MLARDGAAVEIVGLCKAVVSWLAELNHEKLYSYSGVTLNSAKPTER